MHVCVIGPGHDVGGGITESHRAWLRSSAMEGLELEHFATTRSAVMPVRMIVMVAALFRFVWRCIRGQVADVVHVQMASRRSFFRKLAYIVLANWASVPVVVQLHGSGFASFRSRNAVNRYLVDWGLRQAQRVLVLHREMERQVREWTRGATSVAVVYNGVVLSEHKFEPDAGERERVVLFMGAVGARKGTHDLARAAGRVARDVPGVRFLFAGEGETRKLSDVLVQSGADEVSELLGWVEGRDRNALHADACVFCLPSYAEQLPMSILEAMASGTPVVSTFVAGIPEIVETGRTGTLLRPGDVDGLAEALVQLLRDPALRTEMGRAARARAEESFDHEAVGRSLVTSWQSALLECGVSSSLEGVDESPALATVAQKPDAVVESERT